MTGAIQSAPPASLQSSLSGLNAATARLDRAASSIAAGGDTVDNAVAVLQAKTDFKANAAVLRTLDDMQRTLLHAFDIKA